MSEALTLTLYEISSELHDVIAQVIALEGEVTDEQLAVLEKCEKGLAVKTDGYGKFLRIIQTAGMVFDEEAKRLAKKKSSLAALEKRTKEWIFRNMELMGKDKIEGELFSFRIQNNPVSIEVYDAEELPEEYIKMVRTPRANEIKAALKKGIEIPGARFNPPKRHLVGPV